VTRPQYQRSAGSIEGSERLYLVDVPYCGCRFADTEDRPVIHRRVPHRFPRPGNGPGATVAMDARTGMKVGAEGIENRGGRVSATAAPEIGCDGGFKAGIRPVRWQSDALYVGSLRSDPRGRSSPGVGDATTKKQGKGIRRVRPRNLERLDTQKLSAGSSHAVIRASRQRDVGKWLLAGRQTGTRRGNRVLPAVHRCRRCRCSP